MALELIAAAGYAESSLGVCTERAAPTQHLERTREALAARSNGDARAHALLHARPRRADDEATRTGKEAQYVVTIADINNAYRLLSDSAYLGAVEHAAPLEQLVLIALCAELRARKSETSPLEDVARRLARLVALAGDAGDSSRPPTHGELLEIVDRFADARLLATEQLKRDDRFPALRLNVNSEIVADVLINQSNHPLAARFLRD